jgi:hypothetical protein
MTSAFINEKHCREETIGAACKVAQLAIKERRQFTEDEAARVSALLTTAETVLGLSAIPRDPAELVAYSRRSHRQLGTNKKRTSR